MKKKKPTTDGCKLTMDLTIAPEYKWGKEYEFSGNDHFIIEEEREVSAKQHRRWSIRRANWMQFQKEIKITTKEKDQNTIEEVA